MAQICGLSKSINSITGVTYDDFLTCSHHHYLGIRFQFHIREQNIIIWRLSCKLKTYHESNKFQYEFDNVSVTAPVMPVSHLVLGY